MGVLLDRLKEKKYLVSDGAWGTMLQAAGLGPDDCPEEWNISHPDVVRSVPTAYAASGSDLILTNTFGGSPIKLKKMGFADQAAAFNFAGARHSIEAAPDAMIAGSVGPTGEMLTPLGTMTASEMAHAFSIQIDAMLEAGLRVICVETMSAMEEAVCAIRVAKDLDASCDVICTMTFSATPKGPRTMMGIDCEQAAKGLAEAGADVVGANCGNGIQQMIDIARLFREHTDRPVLIHANAGLPELVNGKTVFCQTPEDMATGTEALVAAGANIIGGCCGTTPAHISAIKNALDALASSA